MSLLWGPSGAGGGAGSDDDKDLPAKKKRATGANRAARPKAEPSNVQLGDAASSADGTAGPSSLFSFMAGGVGSKKLKSGAETKDLDKSESICLQAQQLKLQLEDSRSFTQVSLTKTSSLLEKIDGRLNESSKTFVELIRVQGPGCRAETVLQNLKDSKAMLEGVHDLLEALQDSEASPATLQARAMVVRNLNITVPMQVSNILCQRSIMSFAEEDKLDEIMKFLDINFKDAYPNGIVSLLPTDLAPDAVKLIATEFQSGCITYVINQHFLRDYNGDGGSSSDAHKAFMQGCLNKIQSIIKAFTSSSLYDVAAPLKSSLRDDLQRLMVLLQVALSTGQVGGAEIDAADAARSQLVKNKGGFQSSLTVYPVGAYLCEQVQKISVQFKKDQILEAEMEAVGEFAQSMKTPCRELLTKEREGEVEVAVPAMSKFVDMVAKFANFKEQASERCKAACESHLTSVEGRISQLRDALIDAASFKAEKKFPQLPEIFGKLAAGEIKHDQASECLQLLGDIASYQFLPKLPTLKLLGKEISAEIEGMFASVTSTGRLMQTSWAALSGVASGSLNEGFFMDERFVALFKHLKDDTANKHVSSLLPSSASVFSKLAEMLQTSVATFVKQTTSTFHGFVLKLMEPEIKVDSDGGKTSFDYCHFYQTYQSALKAVVSIPCANNPQNEVKVNASFLCLAGALLDLSKYVTSFQEKFNEVSQIASFCDLINADYESVKEKKKPDSIYQMTSLLQMCSHFAKFSSLSSSLAAITKDFDDGEMEKNYHQQLLSKMSGSILNILALCNNELGNAWKSLDEIFKKVMNEHDYPALFQSEKLDKVKISALARNSDTKYLVFLGPRCGTLCHDIKTILEATRVLLKEVTVPQNVLNMLSALEDDLSKFGSGQQGVPAEGAKVVLAHFSFFQASLTLGQVLSRDLCPGETRLGLAKRAVDLLATKGMQFEPNLKRREEEVHLLGTGRPGNPKRTGRLVGPDAHVVLKPLMDAMRPEESPQAVSLVVVFCSPQLAHRHLGRDGGDRPSAGGAFHVGDVDQMLPAYVVHIQLYGGSENDEGRMGSPSPERARSMSRQRKVSLTNPLIQETLLRLPSLKEDSAGTVLLSSNSQEAEAVVSLYLQSGGAARLRRPPGVDLREALGGVVVQRFENKHLAQQYLAIEVDAERGGPRFKEDVVWHGTRLKRSDGDATLAHKLQSIAEHGFDPSRCIKGAHAEGGIWVASCPMESFGVGGDGLVAFIICLAKTTFNEWVDTSCARVLQRERVLPLYSLVHV
eukprot:s191_g17.t1